MAIIALGPTVTGIRGTIGGICFSANRSTTYARQAYRPSNPRSANQLTARTRLNNLAVAWRALTSVQRASWDTYAALPAQQLTNSLGDPYFVSGFNWYVTTQINLQHIGAAATTTAPAGARIAAPIVTNIRVYPTSSANSARFLYDAADPNLAAFKAVWANIQNSTGILNPPNRDYLMKVAVPDGARLVIFQNELETKFGELFLGQRAYCRTYNIGADGQASIAVQLNRDVQF